MFFQVMASKFIFPKLTLEKQNKCFSDELSGNHYIKVEQEAALC